MTFRGYEKGATGAPKIKAAEAPQEATNNVISGQSVYVKHKALIAKNDVHPDIIVIFNGGAGGDFSPYTPANF